MFASIIELLDQNNEKLEAPKLRNLATGGAPLDPDLKKQIEEIFGLQLNNGYGITETSPTISVTTNEYPRTDLSVGFAMPDVEVKIRNPNKESIGEILVRGKNIMKGYYREPEMTKNAMTSDGFFKTGDLGYIEPDGSIFVVGRLKELIIRSGFNVYPPEVEAMLTKHPNVYQSAVIGRSVKNNEEILAFILTDGSITEDILKVWLKERLAPYKIPQRIFIIKQFPTAATGKILKHKLLSHFADII
jgi:acyl-CoA synthetase (AMP-forming)/AMP-acid ligase II